MGAPITAYNRICSDPIRVHSNIYNPDYVAVVDETLLQSVDVTAGLKPEGALIVNTPKSSNEIRAQLPGFEGKIVTIDARRIAEETLGKNFPNSSMLAAVVAVTGLLPREAFLKEMRTAYAHKFAKKPEVVEGNMKALEMTLDAIA